MILVDANILLYAVNDDAPLHQQAKTWWESVLSGSRVVGIPWVVAMAFLRISANPRVFSRPLTPEQAIAYLDEWLRQPVTQLLVPGDKHWHIMRNLLLQNGMAGNLTTDAHIAALALEQGYSVYSCDNDFKRFAGVRHINPLILPVADKIHEKPAEYG